MMFTKMVARKNAEFNGCQIKPRTPENYQFPFGTDLLELNKTNVLGLEFSWDNRIRICGIATTDFGSLVRMLDALILLARRFGYKRLFYADVLSEELVDMLLDFGFEETKVYGDPYNVYLDFQIKGGDLNESEN